MNEGEVYYSLIEVKKMIALPGVSGSMVSWLIEALICQKKGPLAIDIVKLKGDYNWHAPYPHLRSLEVVDALAKKRGSEAGVEFAEAFILIKEFVE